MKVRIGSTKYELLKSKTDLELNDVTVLGLIESDQSTITICSEYPEQTKKQIFWHEIIHGMMWELGMTELGSDEGFVDSLSKLLYAFHEDNRLDKIYEKLT